MFLTIEGFCWEYCFYATIQLNYLNHPIKIGWKYVEIDELLKNNPSSIEFFYQINFTFAAAVLNIELQMAS